MSTSDEEREGTRCRPREQQIAVFLGMEMGGHRTFNPPSSLTLHSCLPPCASEATHSVVMIARLHMSTFTSG